jgi:hypothetical protein
MSQQPPQNQWNNQQPGLTPQVKPLPPNWQQPVQPQWNPTGLYGGEPEPKKGLPGWAWALIAIVVLAVIAGIVLIIVSVVYKPNYQTPDTPAATSATSGGVVAQRPTLVPTRAYATPTVAAVAVATKAQLPTPTPLPPPVSLVVNSYRFQADITGRIPKPGFVYFIVDFTLKNNSQTPLYIGLSNITVQSRAGYSYEYSSISYELDKSLKQATLSPGEAARGELAYEVPSDEILVSGKYEDFNSKITVPIG